MRTAEPFAVALAATLVIEGLILLLFRFSLPQSGKPFLFVNLFTQIALNVLLALSGICHEPFREFMNSVCSAIRHLGGALEIIDSDKAQLYNDCGRLSNMLNKIIFRKQYSYSFQISIDQDKGVITMPDEERKLTKAEAERANNFYKQSKQFESEGYSSEKCCVSALNVNLYAILLSIPIFLIFALFYYISGGSLTRLSSRAGLGSLLIVFTSQIALIFVHEGLHGLTWGLKCKRKFKSIQYGIIMSALTPYCACLEPLSFSSYILGSMMPLIVLGIGFEAAAIISKNIYIFIIANLNAFGCGGDLIVAFMALRHRKAVILDHPTECGFYAFERQ